VAVEQARGGDEAQASGRVLSGVGFLNAEIGHRQVPAVEWTRMGPGGFAL
jgi:hypothetical protein